MSHVLNYIKNRKTPSVEALSDSSSLPYLSDEEEKEVEKQTNSYIKGSINKYLI